MATAQNAFELLGLPPAYALDPDTLRSAYLRRARASHPDRFVARPAAEQHAAEVENARLNAAYETLRDPVARAELLLRLAGGPTAEQERAVPPAVLQETLEIREEIDDAAAAGDAPRLAALHQRVTAGRDAVLADIAAHAARLPAEPAAIAALRLLLNSVRYYDRMLAQFDPAWTDEL